MTTTTLSASSAASYCYTNRFDQEDEDLVLRVLRNGNLSPYFMNPRGGPVVQELEKEFAEYVGAEYAVAVSSGTAALHAAYLALGLKRWEHVVVPSHTFIATGTMVLAADGWPLFSDVDARTYCMGDVDFLEVLEDQGQRGGAGDIRAVAPVDLLGYPAPIQALYEHAHAKGIVVVEDACQALGSERRRGKRVGSQFNDMAAWSGQFTKSWTTGGEGGLVTTNDRALAEKVRAIRSHGSHYLDSPNLTYNFRMTELQAAVGLVQLKKYPAQLDEQRHAAEYLMSHLPKYIVPPFVQPQPSPGFRPNWYIIGCKVNPAHFDRARFITSMVECAVSRGEPGRVVSLGYTSPIYLKPVFSAYMPRRGSLGTAEDLCRRWLWFDIHRFRRPRKELDLDLRFIKEAAELAAK